MRMSRLGKPDVARRLVGEGGVQGGRQFRAVVVVVVIVVVVVPHRCSLQVGGQANGLGAM